MAEAAMSQVVFNWIGTALLLVASILLALMRKSMETAVTKATENAVAKANWPHVLARELEKTRGVERQEGRLQSYGILWSRMRTTASYDKAAFNRKAVRDLSSSFSDWYFSEKGGLLLTTPARELYFTLQDLLRSVGGDADWTGERVNNPRSVFLALLDDKGLGKARRFLADLDTRYLPNWPEGVVIEIKEWRSDIEKVPAFWMSISGAQRFSIVQQVASVLRTGLSADVESRLR
jgi:hypothetical protein